MANIPRLGRMADRRRYVVGFAFDWTHQRVALIRKKREPQGADMVDTLNGIGGAVESGETYLRAMFREFNSEAGTPHVHNWNHYATIEGDDYRVYVFRSIVFAQAWRTIRVGENSATDEHVEKVRIAKLATLPDVYTDVRWLVPLALDESRRAIVRVDRRDL